MTRTPDLYHVDTWVFDLDETLYPSDAAVMSQVIDKMTDWVQREFSLTREEAHAMQQHYYTTYGTTLNGLLANNQVRDLASFLDFVHDVDHSVITPDPELAAHVKALDGRRIVYTNGSRKHAEKVIDRLGLNGLFEDLYDIEAAAFTPKPHREGFDRFTGHFSITPQSTVMFEDSVKNLQTAHDVGFTTVLVHPPVEALADGARPEPLVHPPHIHYAVDCLRTFLGDWHAAAENKKKTTP